MSVYRTRKPSATMPLQRTVSWTRIDRAGSDNRPKIPAGMLGARTRPLVIAGRYDRAAIMAAACKAAAGIQRKVLNVKD